VPVVPLVVPEGVDGVETVSGGRDMLTVSIPDQPDSTDVCVAHLALTFTG